MHKYLFQLGNTPELSIQEIVSVYPDLKISVIAPDLISAELKDDAEPTEMISRLGGIVKIIKQLTKLDVAGTDAGQVVADQIADILSGQDKVQFVVSELGRDHLPLIDTGLIKRKLEEYGTKARFRDAPRHGASAAILKNNKKVRELYAIQTSTSRTELKSPGESREPTTIIAETVAVQDIDDWTNRDRNKPYFDAKKGMLPPKVARMMVNLALGSTPMNQLSDTTMLDPFCGSGTILLEASMLGCNAIGSDQDPDATLGTKQNLEWLQQDYQLTNKTLVLQFDATKLSLPQEQRVDFLVTEPFLGKPNPNVAKLSFVYKGLERLYLGAFKHWTKILKNDARVVIIFPIVQALYNGRKKTFSLGHLIDKLETLGYTTVSEPVLYHRPNAVVQRQIYQFKYNQNQQG